MSAAVHENINDVMFGNVISAPEMKVNLILKTQVPKAGFKVVAKYPKNDLFIGITRIVHKESGKTSALCVETPDGLDEAVLSLQTAIIAVVSESKLWHSRLCHVSHAKIRASREMVAELPQIRSNDEKTCKPCCVFRSTRKPGQGLKGTLSIGPLERVYNDVLGSAATCSVGGPKYFETLLDEYSGYSAVRLIRRKSMAGDAVLKMFCNLLNVLSQTLQ